MTSSENLLPVEEAVPELIRNLTQHHTVILTAPPGAGKSTVLPLRLYTQQWLAGKKVIMLEPRRIAARSVAVRMAQLLGQEIGLTVGYRIRFESKESPQTRILVVTEGILIRMLQEDPSLTETGLVIFDEFHERSLHADLSLLLTRASAKIFRPDLKLLIMSATIQSDKLSAHLNAPVVKSSGRQFEVVHRYLGSNERVPLPVRMTSAILQAVRETTGDILAFLPGMGEILRTTDLLAQSDISEIVYPLYGELPFNRQQAAVRPHPGGQRRIILATSVAETSLTIEGVSVVIDCGLARVPRFDPQSGMTRLVTIPVTLDSANQRAGRAGRLGPGICYRLWDENKTMHLAPSRKPEILEADLAPVILDLLNWGVSDVSKQDWIDAPSDGHIQQALGLLRVLGAVDEENRLTSKGRKMADLPVHPRLAHMLLEAGNDKNLISLSCDIAAILEERDLLDKKSGADLCLRLKELKYFRSGEKSIGDRHTLERIIRLSSIWKKITGIAPDYNHWPDQYEFYCGRLLAAAYPDRVGKQLEKWGSRYRMPNGKVLSLETGDAMIHSEWIVVANGDAGLGEGKIFLAAALELNQLPGIQEERLILRWDDKNDQVVQEKEIKKGVIIISSRPVSMSPEADCCGVLIDKIREFGLEWAGTGEDALRLMARINSLYIWRNEPVWSSFTETDILSDLEKWLPPFLQGIKSKQGLNRLDWKMMLQSRLPYNDLKKLEILAPETITVPSSSKIRINYFMDGRPPELHVRLQEIFGWSQTPSVNEERTPLMLHLLSPAYRPVQITRDLNSFWGSAYFEVRKELRSRYPKHSWPEDPLSAQAVRGVKKR
jgi:ATP-dependent helicase HrpB